MAVERRRTVQESGGRTAALAEMIYGICCILAASRRQMASMSRRRQAPVVYGWCRNGGSVQQQKGRNCRGVPWLETPGPPERAERGTVFPSPQAGPRIWQAEILVRRQADPAVLPVWCVSMAVAAGSAGPAVVGSPVFSERWRRWSFPAEEGPTPVSQQQPSSVIMFAMEVRQVPGGSPMRYVLLLCCS